ncbi:MAG: hypothetical protein O3A00_23475 [Planctomycetota bacterium]|nr:hypothetical protein [Planctomycetota bacterium]
MLIFDSLKQLRVFRQLRSMRSNTSRRRVSGQHRFQATAALDSGTESLEDRTLLAADFGDAPDMGAGTGTGDYETLLASTGASHTIDTSRLNSRVTRTPRKAPSRFHCRWRAFRQARQSAARTRRRLCKFSTTITMSGRGWFGVRFDLAELRADDISAIAGRFIHSR